MPNPDGTRIVLPLVAGTNSLRTGPEGGDLAMDSDDSREIKFNQAGTVRTLVTNTGTQTLTNKTITGTLGTDSIEVVAATNAIAASESGKVFFLNHATEFDSTLPAPAAGLRFTFVVTNAPETGSYTITSNAANEIIGQVYTLDVNSATDPDFETAGSNTITFVAAKAVVGDKVELICDGTNWFAYAFCSVFDAITFTDV